MLLAYTFVTYLCTGINFAAVFARHTNEFVSSRLQFDTRCWPCLFQSWC